jgi:hypothetical protein
VNDEPIINAAETPVAATKPVVPVEEPKLLTQAEVDQAIEKRLARERKKFDRELQQRDDENRALRQAPPAPVIQENAPDPNDPKFQNPADYYAALAEHKAKVAVKEALRLENDRRSQEDQARRSQTASAAWSERERTAMKDIEDYEEVADSAMLQRNRAITPAMAKAISESEFGPQMLYHLCKNLEEAKDLAAMSPEKALLKLGKIEAQFEKPATRPTTSAPPPLQPVRGNAPAGSGDPSKMTDAQYLAWRKSQYQASPARGRR